MTINFDNINNFIDNQQIKLTPDEMKYVDIAKAISSANAEPKEIKENVFYLKTIFLGKKITELESINEPELIQKIHRIEIQRMFTEHINKFASGKEYYKNLPENINDFLEQEITPEKCSKFIENIGDDTKKLLASYSHLNRFFAPSMIKDYLLNELINRFDQEEVQFSSEEKLAMNTIINSLDWNQSFNKEFDALNDEERSFFSKIDKNILNFMIENYQPGLINFLCHTPFINEGMTREEKVNIIKKIIAVTYNEITLEEHPKLNALLLFKEEDITKNIYSYLKLFSENDIKSISSDNLSKIIKLNDGQTALDLLLLSNTKNFNLNEIIELIFEYQNDVNLILNPQFQTLTILFELTLSEIKERLTFMKTLPNFDEDSPLFPFLLYSIIFYKDNSVDDVKKMFETIKYLKKMFIINKLLLNVSKEEKIPLIKSALYLLEILTQLGEVETKNYLINFFNLNKEQRESVIKKIKQNIIYPSELMYPTSTLVRSKISGDYLHLEKELTPKTEQLLREFLDGDKDYINTLIPHKLNIFLSLEAEFNQESQIFKNNQATDLFLNHLNKGLENSNKLKVKGNFKGNALAFFIFCSFHNIDIPQIIYPYLLQKVIFDMPQNTLSLRKSKENDDYIKTIRELNDYKF